MSKKIYSRRKRRQAKASIRNRKARPTHKSRKGRSGDKRKRITGKKANSGIKNSRPKTIPRSIIQLLNAWGNS